MSFLQPLALFGGLLVLVPILIHLLNLARHQRQDWAAMRFLFKAKEKATKSTKLKHWLILLLRTLVLICLTLLIARPVDHSGNFWISLLGEQPVTTVCILDRSASMERFAKNSSLSLREEALKIIFSKYNKLKEGKLVIFDTTGSLPLILDGGLTRDWKYFSNVFGSTDTDANLPTTLGNVFEWLTLESISNAKILIFSDLQSSNWKLAENAQLLNDFAEKLSVKKGAWRLEFVGLEPAVVSNRSISIRYKNKAFPGSGPNLWIEATPESPEILSLTVGAKKKSFVLDLNLTGSRTIIDPKSLLERDDQPDWASFQLPEDSSPFDNKSYYVLNRINWLNLAVTSSNLRVKEILLAATSHPERAKTTIIAEAKIDQFDFSKFDLWILHANPAILAQPLIKSFIHEGGTMLFFPSSYEEGTPEKEKHSGEPSVFSVQQWNQNQGILANSSSGQRIPFEFLKIRKRWLPKMGEPLAFYGDGKPFLAAEQLGDGLIYYFSTLPLPAWSNLEEGFVLIPIIQRILSSIQATSLRNNLYCGSAEAKALDDAKSLILSKNQTPFLNAGIYTSNQNLFALNRPPHESDFSKVSLKAIQNSIPGPYTNSFNQNDARPNSEYWKFFLLLGMILLVAESFFALPNPSRRWF